MHKVIERFFIQNNYDEIEINIDEIKVYYKDKILYSVVNLEEKEKLTAFQYNNIINQLYDGVLASECEVHSSMIFSCGKDVNYIANLYTEEKQDTGINEVKVIVDTEAHRIMMIDNPEEKYINLCRDLSIYINAYCGTDVESRARENELQKETDVKQYLKMGSVILCIINIVIFFACIIRGDASFDQIMDKFSLNWGRVKNNGEWYRVISSMFLHWDWNHILNNMITLCAIGISLEKIIGRKWIFISYFVTGILAGLTSMGYNMFLGEEVYAAGASGAIFGLIGMLAILLITSRADGANISGRRLLIYVVLVIWSSLSTSEIDNAAHIGGFIAGVLLGIVYVCIRNMQKHSRK